MKAFLSTLALLFSLNAQADTVASVNSISTLQKTNSTTFCLTVNFTTVIDDNTLSYTNTATACASSINPLLPNWKSRIRDAVIARAYYLYALDVNYVLFPDFGVLGI